MAITYISTTENYYSSPTPVTNRTFAVNVGSGSNRGLIAIVTVRGFSGTYANPTATYNGNALTSIINKAHSSLQHRQHILYIAPGDTGSNDLSVSWAMTPNGVAQLEIHAVVLNGMAQSSAADQTTSGEGVTVPSLSLTPTVDNEIVMGMYIDEYGEILANDQGTIASTSDNGAWTVGTSYVIQTTAGAQTLSWSGLDDDWTMVAASFKEEAAAGRTTYNTDSNPLGLHTAISWRLS